MATLFDDWIKALDNLQKSVSKDLKEIRQQKADIQQLKADIFNKVAQGRVIRDDHRLVLSAPEIIIGNVDAGGMMYSENGTIVIRGQRVGVEGVGENGIVESRAATISQVAVDPGPDGVDAVVRNRSAIISQAKQIALQSNKAEENGFFSRQPQTTDGIGVRIHSDQCLDIDASESSVKRSEDIDKQIENLNDVDTSLTADFNAAMTAAKTLAQQMNALLELQDPLTVNEFMMRTTVTDLDSLTEQFYSLLPTVYNALENAVGKWSRLAETKRRITALKAEKTKVDNAKATFDDNCTDAVLHVNAEQMSFKSIDGDGKIRTNKEASINMQTGKVDITTQKSDGTLIDESHVNINTHEVVVSTGYDKLGNGGEIESSVMDGNVMVCSKDILFSAYGQSDGKFVQAEDSCFSIRMQNMQFVSKDENKDAAGKFDVFAKKQSFESYDNEGNTTGSFNVRAKDTTLQSYDKEANTTGNMTVKAENITLSSADKSGSAIGQFCLNSKNVFVKSMDSDDKGADKNLASGGNMVLVAEKMFMGRTDKDNTSTELQISSDKTGIYGTTTAEIQQGEAKAVVQLDGGNVAISGSKAEFYGDNTINGKSDFKSDVTMTKATADNLEAKKSFKSKNISDGMAAPGASSSASLSAKLTEADAPKATTNEDGNQE